MHTHVYIYIYENILPIYFTAVRKNNFYKILMKLVKSLRGSVI